jgi:membrane-bound lytic murein transglycosylase A
MKIEAVSFKNLPGWETDDHSAALSVFQMSCDEIRENALSQAEDWRALCEFAKTAPDARAFFELLFQPVLIEDGKDTLFTGYYEPEIVGSRVKTTKFKYPLYKRPSELVVGIPWKTHAEIENGALEGRGLELAWLSDPVENFFLHVQGSGRLLLNQGDSMRVGFDAKNGQPYKSIGQEMVRLGLIDKSKASAQRIKAWVRKNPIDGRKILHHNPSFVFFRELTGLDPDAGPFGALGVSVSTGRTIAIDPLFTPLGAPVWIDKAGADPIQRLMIAQDVGSAIKGAQRADIYFGSGPAAGRIAGRTKANGRMYTLLPHASARRILPEG